MDLIKDRHALIHSIQATLGEKAEIAAIVIDTVNRSLNGSENKDEDMGAYIRAADELVTAFNCAVILVHHCGHEGSRPRGHSALLGAVDMQIAVTRDAANNIVATVECAKDGPDGARVVSRLEQVELGIDDDGELTTSCIMVPAEATGTVARRMLRLPKAAKIALGALQEALANEGTQRRLQPHTAKGARHLREVVAPIRLPAQHKHWRGPGQTSSLQTCFGTSARKRRSSNLGRSGLDRPPYSV